MSVSGKKGCLITNFSDKTINVNLAFKTQFKIYRTFSTLTTCADCVPDENNDLSPEFYTALSKDPLTNSTVEVLNSQIPYVKTPTKQIISGSFALGPFDIAFVESIGTN